jgi:hypothetical protein
MQEVGVGFQTDASVADVEIGDHQSTSIPGQKQPQRHRCG